MGMLGSSKYCSHRHRTPEARQKCIEHTKAKLKKSGLRGQISFATITGYVISFVIYVVGFYPLIQTTIQSATNLDPFSASLIAIVPAAFFIAMIIGIFNYALGRRPAGAWGGG